MDEIRNEMEHRINELMGNWVVGDEHEKLKYIVFNEADMKKKNGNCIICFEEYKLKEHVVKLNCNHTYHRKCINEWAKKGGKCPLCRDNIKGNTKHV